MLNILSSYLYMHYIAYNVTISLTMLYTIVYKITNQGS